jgi:hypothetical protein
MKNCVVCKKVFRNHSLYSDHECDPVESIFKQCRYCSLLFDDEKKRNIHENQCATGKCLICEKWMKKKNLTRHMSTVHIEGEAMFTCDKCDFFTKRKDNLKSHKCSKTEYPCKICNKCFASTGDLKEHSYSHRKHTCEECGKSYSNLIDLTKHVSKAHSPQEVKEFKCDLCNFKCSNQFNLKIHQQRKHETKNVIENNLGIYKIDDSQVSKTNLTKQAISCYLCGQIFSKKANCQRHVLQQHGNSPKHPLTRNKGKFREENLKETTKKKYEQIKVRQLVKQVDEDVEKISSSPIIRGQIISRITELEKVNTENVMNHINNMGVSDRKILKDSKFIRQEFGRNVFQNNISRELTGRKLFFKDLLKLEKIQVTNKANKIVRRWLVYTKDMKTHITRTIKTRGLDLENVDILLSCDDGKKSLKFIVNVTSEGDEDDSMFKNSGAKRTQILAIGSRVTENYSNIKLILEKIQYPKFNMKHKWVADLKLVNIMVGIGPNSSRFSCPFGDCYRNKKNWIVDQRG